MIMPATEVDTGALGPLQSVHKRSLLNVVGPLFFAVLIPAAAAAMVYAVVRFVPASDRDMLDKAWLLVVASAIGSLALLWSWAKNLGLHVDVHEHGFVLHYRSQTQPCRWDDIAELWSTPFHGATPGSGRQAKTGYTVRKRDGANILLTPALAGLERLADRLREETYRRMMPWALSQFQAGAQVTFGMYSVSRHGLAVSSPQFSLGATMLSGGAVTSLGASQTTFVPWSEFSQVRPETHWLRLVRPGLAIDWMIIYRLVPNSHVLLALLQQVFPNAK
ncbi:MAG: hypothetical protein HY907_08585 [Deltaproteobacteria bacterium]|nr:hypothetical protein [Deltaproteobacteria bacterium]